MATKDTRAAEFVMQLVAACQRYRQPMYEKWEEVVANFSVEPTWGMGNRGERSPYRYGRRVSLRDQIVLKDPETHKMVWSYAAKIVRALLGDPKGQYVQAEPVGHEDVAAAATVSRLLRYTFRLPGNFRAMVEAVVDMLLFGTSVVETPWRYMVREMPVREVQETLGIEVDRTVTAEIPVYDDPVIRPVDVVDFFFDPTEYLMEEMSGVAKRFRITPARARQMVASGIYDRSSTERAIAKRESSDDGPTNDQGDQFRRGHDQPEIGTKRGPWQCLIGYEFWGEVPWEDDRDGMKRRVITVLAGEVVRDQPYPLGDPQLPFHALTINPVQGRFYGQAPAEMVRYDQSFADAVKILLAQAIIRQVHPPIAYDSTDTDLDLDKVRAWKADAMVGVRGGPQSIGTLRYDANVQNGMGLLNLLIQNIQNSSSMTEGATGQPGPDREAASVGVQRIQMALDRPELAAMLLENEFLPSIARGLLRRHQQFLTDSVALSKRIGQMPEGVWIGTIMGDFDISFVGSRQMTTKVQKLQSLDRLAAMRASIPEMAMVVPWQQIAGWMIGEVMELPEVAALVGNPQVMQQNAMLGQMASQQASPPAIGAPPGLLPAQAEGGEL